MADKTEIKARFATLDELRATTLLAFLHPLPSYRSCRLLLWGVPRIKMNPEAKRGGGAVYYSVSGVEKMLRARIRARGEL